MTTQKGTVDKVIARTVNTKKGPMSVYDILVDGTKYQWGFSNPTKAGITDGAEIDFVASATAYGPKIDPATVSVTATGTGATPVRATPADASGTSFRSGRVFPVPATSGEIAIIRQNALTNARELVTSYPALFGCDTSGDAMIQKVLDVARTFADYTSGRDVEEKVAKLALKMEE